MPHITLTDSQGTKQADFTADPTQSIGTQGQEEGVAIPFSCGVGACRTCIGVVTKGGEYLEPEAVGPMHIEVEANEVLTCVCGTKSDAPADAEIEIAIENL